MQTLQQIDAYLGNSGNVGTTITAQLANCGKFDGSNTWTETNTFPTITLGSNDLSHRLNVDELNITSNYNAITS